MTANAKEFGKPSPAELFERFFGRSLFVPWSRILLEPAKPQAAAVLPDVPDLEEDERKALIQAVSRDAEGTLSAHTEGDRLRFPTPNYIATATA